MFSDATHRDGRLNGHLPFPHPALEGSVPSSDAVCNPRRGPFAQLLGTGFYVPTAHEMVADGSGERVGITPENLEPKPDAMPTPMPLPSRGGPRQRP